jgi:hypothetical protein
VLRASTSCASRVSNSAFSWAACCRARGERPLFGVPDFRVGIDQSPFEGLSGGGGRDELRFSLSESLGRGEGVRGALLSDALEHRLCFAQLLGDDLAGRCDLTQPSLVLSLLFGEVGGGRLHGRRVLPFSVRELLFERSACSRSVRQLRRVLGMLIGEFGCGRSHLRGVSLLGVAERRFRVQQVPLRLAQGLLDRVASAELLREPGVELQLLLCGSFRRGLAFADRTLLLGL